MKLPAKANILIIKLSAIGDVIQTLPALNTLRENLPQAHITWLVEEAAMEVLQGHPALDRVLVSRRQAWPRAILSGRVWSAFKEIGTLVRALRERPYDLIIDFQGLFKSGLWVGMARGHQKVGFGPGMQHQEGSYWFLNHQVPAVSMEMHALERYLWLLAQIDLPNRQIQYRLPISDGMRQQITVLLQDQGVDPSCPLVAINPMTRWPTKHWRPERFAQLADLLVSPGGVQVVFSGSAGDRDGIQEIRRMMSQSSANLAGLTSLPMLGAFLERVGCLITTDTGPMHLAAAVGTHVVALFGPTAPWRTGPYGKTHAIVRLDLPCSPCFKRRCELHHHDCMNRMTVDQVWESAARAGCLARS